MVYLSIIYALTRLSSYSLIKKPFEFDFSKHLFTIDGQCNRNLYRAPEAHTNSLESRHTLLTAHRCSKKKMKLYYTDQI